MTLRKKEYRPRLIDDMIEDYLRIFGAINITGPKWCGKTWTSLNHANSAVFLDDTQEQQKAELDLDLILNREAPELIDEWNIVPQVWDAVRRQCDLTGEKGKYILTCSTRLTDKVMREKVHHSGAGRIGSVRMRTMSLLETGESDGLASITAMRNGVLRNQNVTAVKVVDLADAVVRGGWPSNQDTLRKYQNVIPRDYINTILDRDIHEDKHRNRDKMYMLLRSLARNEASLAKKSTLMRDINETATEEARIDSKKTLDDYLDVLKRLYLIEDQLAYTENYRSSERVGKSAKRHFVDPSLACAVLNLTSEKLLNDINTFGFMFEALVERDLRVYMDILGGTVRHFRDNITGLEVDAILEFDNSNYAAVEIKLGADKINEAKYNLLAMCENMRRRPEFMCIVVGNIDMIARDPETGIYIVPASSLAP